MNEIVFSVEYKEDITNTCCVCGLDYVNNDVHIVDDKGAVCLNCLKEGDEWFEEVCGTCQKVKLVHDDERDTLGNPGFICEQCENNREDFEKFMEDMLCGDEDE